MANIEMVRMIRQDKKLSNPSKPPGKKNADFSHMLSAKAADVKDADCPGRMEKSGKSRTAGKQNQRRSRMLMNSRL